MYDRKTHLFRYRDLVRITRVLEPTRAEDLPDITLTLTRVAEDLARVGGQQLEALAQIGVMPAMAPGVALTLLAAGIGAVATAAETALNFIRYEGFPLFKRLLPILGGAFFAPDKPSTTLIEEVPRASVQD